MTVIAQKLDSPLWSLFEDMAKGFFLYSIWVNNIFINVKDITANKEARQS